MRRLVLLGIAGTLVLTAAPADAAAPTRTVIEIPRHIDFSAGEQCAFPIRLTLLDNTFTATVFSDENGDPVREIDSGHLSVRVRNQDTGDSVSYNISGPVITRFGSDGSQTITFLGPGLFSLFPGDVGGPGLIRTIGRVVFHRAPSGAITSISANVQPVDVCDLLS
jgi:hypothetical protein